MNWRTSSADLAKLYERAPWLYMIEWRERLDRCVSHLQAGAQERRLEPDEARIEARSIRMTAAWLTAVAEQLEDGARRTERIDALRNVEGRTPEEAVMFRAKADELEREGT